MDIDPKTAKFALFRGIKNRNQFYSTNCPNEDQTRLADGTIAYTIIGYANTSGEAQVKLNGVASPSVLVVMTAEECPFEGRVENQYETCSKCQGNEKCAYRFST